MFWNRNSLQIYKHKLRINFNIRCFEIKRFLSRIRLFQMINFNIRCFEIEENRSIHYGNEKINFNIRCFEIDSGWIRPKGERDKLQHKMFWNKSKLLDLTRSLEINFNIRCFEICLPCVGQFPRGKINFNIRCFEISRRRGAWPRH